MTETVDLSTAIGVTSTIPVEIVLAAGHTPVDLNNTFVTSNESERFLGQAESAGFAHNICAWIKGIYSAVIYHGVKRVIAGSSQPKGGRDHSL